jgi:type I restriction enzyme S subunit
MNALRTSVLEGNARQVRLGDISTVVGGIPAPQDTSAFSDEGMPFVRMRDLGRVHNTACLTLTDDRLSPSFIRAKKIEPIPAGSIIMPRSGSVALNHRALLGVDAYIVNHICALVPHRDTVVPEYLYRVLCETRFDQITRKTTGLDAINFADLRNVEIRLPPLGEQTRIAAILDKADSIRSKRREALTEVNALLRATFLDVFGDPIANPKRWNVRPLDELLTAIDSGWSPVCDDRPASEGQWGVLKLSAVTRGVFLPGENKRLPDGIAPRPALEVKPHDLLFSRKNTRDLVAATAFAVDPPRKLMISDLIFRLRVDAAQAVPAFIWRQLATSSKRREAQNLAGGSAGSMPNISKERLRTLNMIVPPMGLQEQFAQFVAAQLSLQHRLEILRTDSDTLYASLAQRGFRGEL